MPAGPPKEKSAKRRRVEPPLHRGSVQQVGEPRVRQPGNGGGRLDRVHLEGARDVLLEGVPRRTDVEALAPRGRTPRRGLPSRAKCCRSGARGWADISRPAGRALPRRTGLSRMAGGSRRRVAFVPGATAVLEGPFAACSREHWEPEASARDVRDEMQGARTANLRSRGKGRPGRRLDG
jgi:hypothetical protein